MGTSPGRARVGHIWHQYPLGQGAPAAYFWVNSKSEEMTIPKRKDPLTSLEMKALLMLLSMCISVMTVAKGTVTYCDTMVSIRMDRRRPPWIDIKTSTSLLVLPSHVPQTATHSVTGTLTVTSTILTVYSSVSMTETNEPIATLTDQSSTGHTLTVSALPPWWSDILSQETATTDGDRPPDHGSTNLASVELDPPLSEWGWESQPSIMTNDTGAASATTSDCASISLTPPLSGWGTWTSQSSARTDTSVPAWSLPPWWSDIVDQETATARPTLATPSRSVEISFTPEMAEWV